MRAASWLTLPLLAFLGATAATAGPAPAARTVVLAADRWCPVTCDSRASQPGYAVELAREAFALSGLALEYRVIPWERAVDAARAGRIDGVIGTVMDGTPDFVFPQEAAGTNTNVFFVRGDSTWRYRGLRSLDGVVLGIANEYNFSPEIDTYAARFRDDPARIAVLYSTDPVAQAMKMLRAGRIDAYLDDRLVVNWALRQAGDKGTVRESGKLNAIPLYVAFSPARAESRATADAFDRGMRELRASGRLAAILATYGVADWVGIEP